MTNKYKEILNDSKYDFFKTNPHLADRTCLVVMAGSISHGTNGEKSDIDIRGVALNRPEEIIGYETFDNYIDNETDTVVYGINKFIKLLTECNPSIIEMIGTKKEHILEITPVGQMLIDNKDLFLSQRVYNTFGGYALAQLNKINNALAGTSEKQSVKEEHILNSIKRSQRTWDEQFKKLHEGDYFKMNIDKSDKADLEEEIFVDVHLTHYPLRDTHAAIKELTDIIRNYDKLQHRNHKNTDEKLSKHMAHLVRLYKMGAEILRTGEVNTYRENDREELLAIKNGKYLNKDGSVKEEFRDYVNELEKDLEKALSETKLPKKPDYEKIQKFVMDINMNILNEAEMKKMEQNIKRGDF